MNRARLYRLAATISILIPTLCIIWWWWALFWGDYPLGDSEWVSATAEG